MTPCKITVFTLLNKHVSKFSYEGLLTREGERFALSYFSPDQIGVTEILYTGMGVRVSGKGEFFYSIDYLSGEETSCELQTPYGAIDQRAVTRKIESSLANCSLSLFIDADVFVGGEKTREKLMLHAEWSA